MVYQLFQRGKSTSCGPINTSGFPVFMGMDLLGGFMDRIHFYNELKRKKVLD